MAINDLRHLSRYIKESMDASHVRETAEFLCVLRDATKVFQDFLDLHIGYAEDSAESIDLLIGNLKKKTEEPNATHP